MATEPGRADDPIVTDGPPTPFAVLDVDRLGTNLASMAAWADSLGVALRPHAKTHKCLEIARRQIEAGAAGLTVATVGEAKVFAAAGIEDLFVAYPLWAPNATAALNELVQRCSLRVGIDSTTGARALAAALGGRRDRVGVLVEVDSGQRRSGVAPDEAGRVADAGNAAGLQVLGAFTFPGHGYGPGRPSQAAAEEARALEAAAASLDAAGVAAPLRSGGSTPTARHARPGTLDELRPGVYALNDAQQVALGTCGLDQVALFVAATVVSVPDRHRFVLDAGSKALGADGPAWMPGFGTVLGPGAPTTISQLSEHHGVVSLSPEDRARGAQVPAVGGRVAVVPNHVCSAVNLAEGLVVCSGKAVIDHWAVAARGRNT